MHSSTFIQSGLSIRFVRRSLTVGLIFWLLGQLALAQQITTVVEASDYNYLSFQDMHVDGSGNIYVCDYYGRSIHKFPPNSTSATVGVTVAGGNGEGSAANQLYLPYGLYVDGSGNLYVVDQFNARVQKFPPNSTSATAGITVVGGSRGGSAANQLNFATDVCVDGSGNIYVADLGNHRIQKFPPNSTSATAGVTVAGGNGQGSAPNQLYGSNAVSVDGSGNLYVSDNGNNRIQKYTYPPVILSQPVAGTGVCTGATVKAQDTKLSLSLPASATLIDNRSVTNSAWQLSGPSNGYYILTTSQVVPAGDKLSVGLTGSFNPGGASGGLTVSGTLVGGSGGEQRTTNNTEADRLEYFQQ